MKNKAFHIKPNLLKKGLLFLIFTIWMYTISKKFDWVFFPYNNMFANSNTNAQNLTSYGLKKNGTIIAISHFPYWKKDLLEQSITHFAYYVLQDNKQYADIFFEQRKNTGMVTRCIGDRLKTPNTSLKEWANWYFKMTNQNAISGDSIALMSYQWKFDGRTTQITDSITLKTATF